jgi:phosphonate transport system substrate-binding protein
MKPLRLTSGMSEAADPFCRALARYLTDQLGEKVVFVDDLPWQERLERLAEGDIHAGWVCGWVYVQCVQVDLLAAPVMAGARYGGQPVYFSDVIVRGDSAYTRLEDMRGTRWAYNERGSFSGYLAMLHRLAQMHETIDIFGETIASGAHSASLQMVVDERADVTALDSTAFDQLRQETPFLDEQVRVVESLGPFPVPPWVVSRAVADKERDALKQSLWEMCRNPHGQAVLSQGLFDRFIPVSDADYDPVRRIVESLPG